MQSPADNAPYPRQENFVPPRFTVSSQDDLQQPEPAATYQANDTALLSRSQSLTDNNADPMPGTSQQSQQLAQSPNSPWWEHNADPMPETSQQSQELAQSNDSPLRDYSQPQKFTASNSVPAIPQQGSSRSEPNGLDSKLSAPAINLSPELKTSSKKVVDTAVHNSGSKRYGQLNSTTPENYQEERSGFLSSFSSPWVINPLESRKPSGEENRSAGKSVDGSGFYASPINQDTDSKPSPEDNASKPVPRGMGESSVDLSQKHSPAEQHQAAVSAAQVQPCVQPQPLPLTYPATQTMQVSPNLAWPMGGMSCPPFQSVPLLTVGPILILAAPQGQTAFGGQPLVQMYQPCPLAPAPAPAPAPTTPADGRRAEQDNAPGYEDRE
ncbi:hypothetical protein ACOMHN_030889 [Nucella lapillus]